jgi:hypothetical protein
MLYLRGIFISKNLVYLLKDDMILEKYYHMNTLVGGNLQQSLTTNDLMNSFRK